MCNTQVYKDQHGIDSIRDPVKKVRRMDCVHGHLTAQWLSIPERTGKAQRVLQCAARVMRSGCLGAAMSRLVERLWLGAVGSLYASGQTAR